MAGGGEEMQFTGIQKYFNSYTKRGKLNVSVCTLLVVTIVMAVSILISLHCISEQQLGPVSIKMSQVRVMILTLVLEGGKTFLVW